MGCLAVGLTKLTSGHDRRHYFMNEVHSPGEWKCNAAAYSITRTIGVEVMLETREYVRRGGHRDEQLG